MRDSSIVTSRRYAFWFGAVLVLVFVVLRVAPFLGANIGRGVDSLDYRAAARLPLLSREFLGGPRPFGYPLFLKLVLHNEHAAVVLQMLADTAAWLALAWMAARVSKTPAIRVAAAVVVLAIGASLDMIQWDRVLSSEALSTAFGVGLLAALLWLYERWTGPRLAVVAALGLAATIVRDSNGTFLGVVAIVLLIGVSLRRLRVRVLALVVIFAAVAALGAGLQVVIGTLLHSTHVSPAFAAFTVAIPVTIYIVVLALLGTRRAGEPAALWPTLLTGALVLTAAAATPVLTLPPSIVIMVVLVTLLLAYRLTAAHRATHQPER